MEIHEIRMRRIGRVIRASQSITPDVSAIDMRCQGTVHYVALFDEKASVAIVECPPPCTMAGHFAFEPLFQQPSHEVDLCGHCFRRILDKVCLTLHRATG